MKPITILLSGLLLALGGLSAHAQQDEAERATGAWQRYEAADFSLALPQGWEQDEEEETRFLHADDAAQITLHLDAEGSLQARLAGALQTLDEEGAVLLSQETVDLPLAEAERLESALGDRLRIEWLFALETGVLRVSAQTEGAAQLREGRRVFGQIISTLRWRDPQPDMAWPLYADPDATVFLRVPPSWSKAPNTPLTLTVQATFTSVLVNVRYQDLGGEIPLEALRERLLEVHEGQPYTVESVTQVNLPVGDALRFRLRDVPITSQITHDQEQFVVLRGRWLVLITTGVDARYASDYESLLRQVVATLEFHP